MNSLELRLGISSGNGLSGGATTLLVHGLVLECTLGACLPGKRRHPWSKLTRGLTSVMSKAPQLVGWSPVCTFRKKLSTPRPADVDDLSKVKPSSEEEHGTGAARDGRLTMFVKVNLEGYAAGRKIDLKAHRSYDVLPRALQSMFHGFLSDGYGRIATSDDDEDQLEKGKVGPKKYNLLYEDNEGDRMLVGDVPWELFIASVKRLYIAQDPRMQSNKK